MTFCGNNFNDFLRINLPQKTAKEDSWRLLEKYFYRLWNSPIPNVQLAVMALYNYVLRPTVYLGCNANPLVLAF